MFMYQGEKDHLMLHDFSHFPKNHHRCVGHVERWIKQENQEKIGEIISHDDNTSVVLILAPLVMHVSRTNIGGIREGECLESITRRTGRRQEECVKDDSHTIKS